MTMKSLALTEKPLHPEAVTNIDDLLVEQLWHDLSGQISQKEITQTVAEIGAQFQDATVKTFVPIFILRLASEQLKGRHKRKSQLIGDSK